MSGSKRRAGAACDFEEVRPNRFVIHNVALKPVLSGEGEIEGDRFTLTSQRREGLIGRLRMRAFAVLTIEEQIAALPPLPETALASGFLPRILVPNERFSTFGGSPPQWVVLPPNPTDRRRVMLQLGAPVWRRKGRGPGEFGVGGGRGPFADLLPIKEDAALLLGYAQLGKWVIPVTTDETAAHFPDLLLPKAHLLLWKRFADRNEAGDGWTCALEDQPLARQLLARLNGI